MNATRTDLPELPNGSDAGSVAGSDEGIAQEGNRITPLPGEAGIPSVAAASGRAVSWKALLAVGSFILTLVTVGTFYFQRVTGGKKATEAEVTRLGDRPSAATAPTRRLEMGQPAPNPTTAAQGTRVPALQPDAELAEPIGVRRTAEGAPAGGNLKAVPPEDAPVLLVSSRPGDVGAASSRTNRHNDAGAIAAGAAEQGTTDTNDPVAATARNMQAYQQQVQGLLNTLTQSTKLAMAQSASAGAAPALGAAAFPPTGALIGVHPGAGHSGAGTPTGAAAPSSGSLFGGQLQASATPRVMALQLGDRNLTLPKGTAFTCALKTKVISAVSGLVGCQVQRDVYSDNGRVLLIERGSHLDGEYRIASVKPGMVRIPVLWTRIRTPLGVTVDIDSPGTGQLGESGIDGYVDNRWPERLGAALLLSLIDDSVRLLIQNQTSDNQGDTIVLPSTTATGSKLAEKVLDSTINIPPLIYQNQGGIVGIYVARDVDFSSVYELRPVP